jgi:hypothetical protein
LNYLGTSSVFSVVLDSELGSVVVELFVVSVSVVFSVLAEEEDFDAVLPFIMSVAVSVTFSFTASVAASFAMSPAIPAPGISATAKAEESISDIKNKILVFMYCS